MKPEDVVETYSLKHPLKQTVKDSRGEREEEIAVVKFRKPLTGDLVALDKAQGDIASVLHFASYVSDVSFSQLQKMELVDGNAIIKIANRFLEAGQATSTTS